MKLPGIFKFNRPWLPSNFKKDARIHNITFFGETDVGLKRLKNEDTFLISLRRRFCLVADGMGGEAAGELASHIFAETSMEVLSKDVGQSTGNIIEQIQNAFSVANERIFKHAKENPGYNGMGCTAEVLGFSDEDFVIGHVGDSRTYRFRNQHLEQLTQDHSVVQDQIDKGMITPAESKNHSMRNVILRAVGVRKNLSPDIIKGSIYPGDVSLLCSDGLTDMVADQQIQEVLSLSTDLSKKTKKLVDMAKLAGGRDNITVVLSET